MSLELVSQSIVYGILNGALYGLVAAGISLIFGVMGLLFIAHGAMLMLSAYIAFYLFRLYNVDPFLSIPVGAIVIFLLGLGLYQGLFSRVLRFAKAFKADTSLLIAFGLIVVLDAAATLAFTPDERSITPSYAGMVFDIFGLKLPYVRLGAMAVAGLVVLITVLFLHKTYFGKSIRATTEDWQAATLMGISVDRTYLLSFGIGTALAAIAGNMVAVVESFSPAMGLHWVIRAIVVMVLAGMGSVGGVLAAGILLGVVEALSSIYIGPYMQVVGLILFLLVVSLRPQGLFGKKE